MAHKTFMQVATAIFAVVAAAHSLRLVLGWGVTIGGFQVPLWWSAVGLLLAGFLAWSGYKLNS